MKFIALGAIVEETLEEKAIELAKGAGAGSVTIIKGHNIPLEEKKTFMGLTYEASVSVLLFILPKKLSLNVMKELKNGLNIDEEENGTIFTMPLTHVFGLNTNEIEKFESEIEEEL